METFSINLIREMVIPPARRRLFFWGMTLLMLICVTAMIVLAFAATQNLAAIGQKNRFLTMCQQKFSRGHPHDANPEECVTSLGATLAATTGTLKSAERLLTGRIDLPRMTLALASELPETAGLKSLRLDGEKKELAFDVTLDINPEAPPLTTSDLIAAWQANPHLGKRIRDIRTVATGTQRVLGNSVMVWQFTAKVSTEG